MSKLAKRRHGIIDILDDPRTFGDTFLGMFDTFNSVFSASSIGGHFHTDMAETDKNFVLRAEVPGVEQDDIEITYDNGILRLTCERQSSDDQSDETMIWQERVYGKFERTCRVENVDPDRITADLKQGVLTVTLAKKEATPPPAPKQIEIKTE